MPNDAPDAFERLRIDHELDRDLLVAAGAGSGKTSKLVDRYVALLQSGCEPDGIVVVTFTRKAAGEMKQRLRSRLGKFADETGDPHWLRRRRAIEEAPIETMDAFCLRLLRAEAITAGLDPGFEILDPAEQTTLPYQVCADVFRTALRAGRTAAETLLEETGGFAPATEALATLLDKRRLWRDPFRASSPLALAERALSYLAGEVDDAPTEDELCDAFSMARGQRLADCLNVLVETLIPELIRIWNGLGPETDPNDKFTPLYRLGQRLAAWDCEAPDYELLRQFAVGNLSGGKAAAWGEALKEAKEFIKTPFRKWCLDELMPLIDGGDEQDRSAARATAAALPLAREAEAALWARKQRVGKLGFDDLLLQAAELLATARGEEVLARVRERYGRVLVDEYQDSSKLQDRLFRYLAGGRPGAFFAVGDDKQSIYGFRDADLSVFNQAREHAGAGLVPLTATFRLAPNLAACLNALFSHEATMGPEPHPEAEDAAVFVPLEAVERPERVLLPGPEVRWMVSVGDGLAHARALEAAAIAADIRKLVSQERPALSEWLPTGGGPDPRPVKYGDIAILLRATTAIELYRNALGALGIPVRTERGKLSRRQEAGDLLAAGRWLLNPRHGLATVALLRSPLIGLSDTVLVLATPPRERLADAVEADVDARLRNQSPAPPAGLCPADHEAWGAAMARLREWREWAAEMPLGQVLRKVVERTGYRAVLAALPDPDRRLANVEKLLDGLAALEAAGLSSDEALAVYEARQSEGSRDDAEGAVYDADADAVSLMSVHNAKGLERPVVYVADLARRPTSDGPPKVAFWRDLPVVAGGAGSEAGVKLPPPLLSEVAPRGPVLSFEDERLLYVACTRARDRLVLSSAVKRNKDGSFGKSAKTWHTALGEAAGLDAEGASCDHAIPVAVYEGEPPAREQDLQARQAALEQLAAQAPSREGVAIPGSLPEPARLSSVASLARAAGEGVSQGEVQRADVGDRAIAGAERGTIVHELLRIAAHRRGPLTPDDVRTAAAGQGRRLDPETEGAAIEQLLAVTGRAVDCAVVRRAMAMAQLMIETPFIRYDGEALISGRVDLVGIDPGGVLLVDYKTGRLDDRLRAQYLAEVGQYRDALAQQYPGRAIEVVLPFLDLRDASGEVVILALAADGRSLSEVRSDGR